jgi:asparagine synthase (glutamine-hydrolysing)
MCGIAGYVGPAALADARLDACLVSLQHRGPDHAARRRFTNPAGRHVDLLHTRLSIIDLDPRAHQPMRIGTRTIAFNGELYNYRELRTELEREGAAFATQSDTEVLLRAIDVWGWDALDRCEGMWAFAVYDEADGALVLCRDRFGEKPLYVYREGGGLYFGSEVKAIAALRGARLRPDIDHLARYLVHGYKALYKTGRTFFAGLAEVPAASVLWIDATGREERARYWAPGHAPEEGLSYGEAVAGVRRRLIRSVELRLRADVPLAFCMSGGIDSNALIGVARHVFDHEVHGFTIVNGDARYEERDMVAVAVKASGVRHTEVTLSPAGFLARLRRLVRQHDAPVYTITYYAHELLMESVADHGYRIALSGTGADELLSGYYDHHLAYLAEMRHARCGHAEALAAWRAHVQPLVRNPHLGDPDLFVRDPDFRDHIFLDAPEFAAYLTRPWAEPFAEERFCFDLLRNRMMNELTHETVPAILHEDDLNAMSFSIENRSPFLDRALAEFAAQIPTAHLIQRGRAKAVLRDAVRGLVPDEVLDNPRKVGFNAPIHDLLDVGDPAVRAQLLEESPVYEHVRRDRIEALLTRSALPNSVSKFLFSFVNAKIFLEEFGG